MKTKIHVSDGFLYFLLGVSIILLVASVAMAMSVLKGDDIEEFTQTGSVYNILNKMTLPVVNEQEITEVKIIRPFTDDNVKIVKNFYDFKDSSENQMNALIYYQDTYMQSNGIAYASGDKFNVIAVLDGEVIDVTEDELLGNSITIDHGNMKTIYQSLSEVDVKKGDKVTQGSIIGITGTSNINSDLGNHLYFEMLVDDSNVNPEEYYDKTI
ncbi:MAG: M23 family metallopeptidase [Bacilli bacterium]|nr:M23 family metallopeptidase [Bacilli bacterium]